MRYQARIVQLALLSLVLGLATLVLADERPKSTTWLGVMLEDDRSAEGVRLSRIVVDSPADKAGLRASDLITAVDGTAVSTRSELIRAIQARDDGSWIPLSVSRAGSERDVRVRLGERPQRKAGWRVRTGWIGVTSIELPPALREHFGAPADAGVMISDVAPASPSEAAGFELGDVVYEVNGEPVRSPGALRGKVAGAGVGNRVEVRLARSGAEIVLEAQIAGAPAKP